MIDTIQINKFSNLHNGKTIIFCKTDYLIQEFENIKNINNDVILISGNSDYVIDSNFIPLIPKNLKKWFAQNALFKNEIVEPIPIGIENRYPSIRDGHGIGYFERVEEKENVISNHDKIEPTKFIYSNFNLNTNFTHRNEIKNICINNDFIDWEEPVLSINDFFKTILNYEAVVCAQGNGPGDNHRIYETLYMGRIPITFNKTMFDVLHNLFPVVLIENYQDLDNFNIMSDKIKEAKNKKWEKELLICDNWIKKIKNYL